MSPTRILLADDHPVVRSGIRYLLEKTPDLVVVGESSSGEQVLPLVQELSPDILLLDMEMPGMSGTEVVQQLQKAGANVRILVLSVHDDKTLIQELLAMGVSGYLVKEEVPDTIVEAVRGVARGEHGWISRQVAAQMSAWIRGEAEDKKRLSFREREVLRAVVGGKTNQEIARELRISEKTVEKHLDGVYTKLGVSSRVEAAVRAVREGWL